MGKGVQRVGDPSSGGGLAVGPGHNNVLVNGRPAAIPFTPFTPHYGCDPKNPIHCFGKIGVVPVSLITATAMSAITGAGGGQVLANGIPLVLDGDLDSCFSHKRMLGSFDVKVG